MITQLLAGPYGPIVIFFLRICDVSLATVRTLLIVRNARILVPFIGFVEVLIWLYAVGTVVQNLSSGYHVLGYALGFAAGNYVGLRLEERMALGLATVQAMLRNGGSTLATKLRDEGFGVTEQVGQGRDGPVEVLYSVIRRRRVPRYVGMVERDAPEAFVVVHEPRMVRRGWLFPRRGK